MEKRNVHALLTALYAILLNSAGRYKDLKPQISGALKSPLLPYFADHIGTDALEDMRQASLGRNIQLKKIGLGIRDLVAENSTTLPPATVPLFKDFSSFFRSGSDSTYKRIQKMSANPIFPTWIRIAMAPISKPQGTTRDDLQDIVKDYAGRTGTALTRDEANSLKANDPDLYKIYLKLRKDFQDSWKTEASNFVRNSGGTLVPMPELIKHLDKQGLEYQIPEGFTGKVNSDLEWFSSDGVRLSSSPAFNTYDRVEMNQDRKPGEYELIAVPREGSGSNPKYIYRVSDLAERKAKKFAAVGDIAPKIKKARNIWLKAVRSFDISNANTVAALVIELSYRFASRIGSLGNSTKGIATFGLSTVLIRHLKLQPNGFTLSYPGKDAIATSHKFVVKEPIDSQILACVAELAEGKSKDDRLFTVTLKNGNIRGLNAATVNAVFKAVVGNNDVSIHKIRTLRATVLFSDQVDAYIKSHKSITATTKSLFELTKKFATAVGKELNHVRTSGDGEPKVTPLTALGSYIDVSAQARLFDHYDVAYPAYLVKALGKHRLEARFILLTAAEQSDEKTPEPDTEEEKLPLEEPTEAPEDGSDTKEENPAPEIDTPEVLTGEEPDEAPVPADEDTGMEDSHDGDHDSNTDDVHDSVPVKEDRPSIDLLTVDPEAELLQDLLDDPGLGEDL